MRSGGDQPTVNDVEVAVYRYRCCGGLGTPMPSLGYTTGDGGDNGLEPIAFAQVARNTYPTPITRPARQCGVTNRLRGDDNTNRRSISGSPRHARARASSAHPSAQQHLPQLVVQWQRGVCRRQQRHAGAHDVQRCHRHSHFNTQSAQATSKVRLQQTHLASRCTPSRRRHLCTPGRLGRGFGTGSRWRRRELGSGSSGTRTEQLLDPQPAPPVPA